MKSFVLNIMTKALNEREIKALLIATLCNRGLIDIVKKIDYQIKFSIKSLKNYRKLNF